MLVYQTNINVMQLMQCRKAVSENQSTDDRGSFPFLFPWADLAGEWRLVVACGQRPPRGEVVQWVQGAVPGRLAGQLGAIY